MQRPSKSTPGGGPVPIPPTAGRAPDGSTTLWCAGPQRCRSTLPAKKHHRHQPGRRPPTLRKPATAPTTTTIANIAGRNPPVRTAAAGTARTSAAATPSVINGRCTPALPPRPDASTLTRSSCPGPRSARPSCRPTVGADTDTVVPVSTPAGPQTPLWTTAPTRTATGYGRPGTDGVDAGAEGTPMNRRVIGPAQLGPTATPGGGGTGR